MVWKLNLTQRHSENFPSLKNRLIPPLFEGDSLEGMYDGRNTYNPKSARSPLVAVYKSLEKTARRTEPALELTRYTRN